MQDLFSKLGNKDKLHSKFVEISLPFYNLIKGTKEAQVFKVIPITINMEMAFQNSVKTFLEGKIQNAFQMYEDIIEHILFSNDDGKQIDFDNLTLYDINYIIYNTRIMSYGNTQTLNLTCTNCKSFYNEYMELENKFKNNELSKSEFEKNLEELKNKRHIHNFEPYMILKNDQFYTKTVEQNLTNFELVVPDKKDDIYYTYKQISGNTIKIGPPKFGWYKALKPYLLDFRLVQEMYEKQGMEIKDQEETSLFYSRFSNLCLFIDSIDNIQIEKEDIQQLPIILQNILIKPDIVNLNNLISNYEKYDVSIPFTYECDVCGLEYNGDVTTFPIEYLFDVKK